MASVCFCIRFAWPSFGSKEGYRGDFSVNCQKLAPCLAESILGSSKDRCAADQGWAIRNGGSTSATTDLRRKKKKLWHSCNCIQKRGG